MAKKRNKEAVEYKPIIENTLPQNILSIGSYVEENKNIYISQPVYKKIHKFTKDKTVNESGGMLIGYTVEEFGKTNIIIEGFIEAKYCEATPTTLKFTHDTWEYCHKEIEKKYPKRKIVGWIHTHPDFGIFLSEYDKFIQENFFNQEYQVAYVIDPIQHIEGFYFWINEKIEKCKGFFIYDNTGIDINVNDSDKTKASVSGEKQSPFSIQNIALVILSIISVFMIFSYISLNSQIEELKEQQDNIVESANYSLTTLQQQLNMMAYELSTISSDNTDKETDTDEETINKETVSESDNATTEAEKTESSNTQEIVETTIITETTIVSTGTSEGDNYE